MDVFASNNFNDFGSSLFFDQVSFFGKNLKIVYDVE